jgi:hypothetical protein
VAVTDQFEGDLVFAECFNCSNCSWTVRQNINVPILIAPIYILTYASLNGVYFGLEYRCVLKRAGIGVSFFELIQHSTEPCLKTGDDRAREIMYSFLDYRKINQIQRLKSTKRNTRSSE